MARSGVLWARATVHSYGNHEQKKSAEANPIFSTRYCHTVTGKIDLEIIDQRKNELEQNISFLATDRDFNLSIGVKIYLAPFV